MSLPTYYAIFTTIGLTRLAEAQSAYEPLVFTHLAVGDGNGSPITPLSSMTALVNETARVTINAVDLSPDSPTTVRVEGLIPANVGGFTIREAGLFNGDGELIAIASYPPIYKPVPGDGVTVEEYIRVLLQYDAVEAIALTTDPNVIVATRNYVDEQTKPRDIGDGSDGSAVLDGVATVAWATLATGVYTATRCPCLEDLTIDAGIELAMAGFVGPLWRGTLLNNGVISHDGSPGGVGMFAGATGGAGAVAGSMLGGFAGADATLNSAGAAGTNATNSLGGAGGVGGSQGGNAGGIGGTVTAPAAARGPTRTDGALESGYVIGNNAGTPTLTALRGGAGGGSGGGVFMSDSGGAGGGGGGQLSLSGDLLINNGEIRTKGGDGGDGGATSGAGGGAGGGGGRTSVKARRVEGTGTIAAPGGTGGLAVGGGNPGGDGEPGTVQLCISANHSLPIVEDSTLTHAKNGRATFTDTDTVVVTFADGWAYSTDDYDIEAFAPVVRDYGGGISAWVESQTHTGFTIRSSAAFTGYVRWRAQEL